MPYRHEWSECFESCRKQQEIEREQIQSWVKEPEPRRYQTKQEHKKS